MLTLGQINARTGSEMSWDFQMMAETEGEAERSLFYTAPGELMLAGTIDQLTSAIGVDYDPSGPEATHIGCGHAHHLHSLGSPIEGSGPGLSQRLTQTFNAGLGRYEFSGNQNVDATLIGSKWSITNLTYSFPTSGSFYDSPYYDPGYLTNHVVFNAAQQTATRYALDLVDQYTNLTFTEVTESTTVDANLRFSQTTDSSLPSAQGNFPGSDSWDGDIWFGMTGQPFYLTPAPGNWGQATIMHEIGHALGLKHGMDDYTSLDLVPGGFIDGPGPRYGSVALESAKDGQAWSLMTYRSNPGAPISFQGDGFNQPQTFMQFDIAALQYMYGANFNTESGNTVYTFSPATGEMFINGVGQGAPTGNVVLRTIWDGNGIDTYDFSNYSGNQTIDLTPGEFSTFSSAQLANHRAYSGGVAFAPGNIANALLYNGDTRSLIENAIGGSGNDTITGNQANNVIEGGAGGDTMDGGTGIDTLDYSNSTSGVNVNASADTASGGHATGDVINNFESIIGSDFDDMLTSAGSGTLTGNDGNDTLRAQGNSMSRTFLGGNGNDSIGFNSGSNSEGNTFDGGAGIDTFYFGAFGGSYIADLEAGVFTDTSGATQYASLTNFENIEAGSGNDTLRGTDGVNVLNGNGGDDIIEGRGGADIMDGGAGFDILSYQTALEGVVVSLATGVGSSEATGDTFSNFEGITGSIYGDTLTGDSGDNTLTGIGGNDVIDGGTGVDTVSGGDGNDIIYNNDGLQSESLDGGFGVDLLEMSATSFGGITYFDLITGLLSFNASSNTETALNFENLNSGSGNDDISATNGDNIISSGAGNDIIRGLDGDDTLYGDDGDDTLEGGSGADALDGGLGFDTATYANESSGFTIIMPLGAAIGSALGDTFQSIEAFIGTDYADTFIGDGLNNDVTGGLGDDYISGGLGDDTLTGDGGNDVLEGGQGADLLDGSSGNDTIVGGAGADVMDGGDGIDVLSYAGSSAGVTASLGSETASGGDATGDSFTNFEALTGSSFDDMLTGTSSGSDTLRGGEGDDVLDGQFGTSNRLFGGSGDDMLRHTGEAYGQSIFDGDLGNDTFDISATVYGINPWTIDLATGEYSFVGSGDPGRLVSIENVIGSQVHDIITGSDGANQLSGMDGEDIIDGGAGSDRIEGGAGADTLDGGTGDNDTVSYEGSGAAVTVLLGSDSVSGGHATGDTIQNFENAWGSAFDDDLEGSSGNNTLRGLDGNDVLDGLGGEDLLQGNAGNDVLVAMNDLDADLYNGGADVDNLDLRGSRSSLFDLRSDTIQLVENLRFLQAGSTDIEARINASSFSMTSIIASSHAGQTLTLSVFMAAETVFSLASVAFSNFVDQSDIVRVTGDNDAEIITGSVLSDDIIGLGGEDNISGGLGDDLLRGGDDNDVLNGGDGDDTLNGGNGDDNMIGGAGSDTFNGGGGNDIGLGGAGNDSLLGQGGDDNMIGGGGDDIINGGGGADTLDGSIGNDVINGGDGNDTILGGAGNDVMEGFTGDDDISGEDGNDQIFGAAGSDTLRGGLGADEIFGGEDDDFIYGDEGDDVLAGQAGSDRLFGSDGNDTINGAAGNDLLFGGAGNDEMNGGSGNDSLYGGPGNDIMRGQGGTDTFIFNASQGGDNTVVGYAVGETIELQDFGYASATDAANDFSQVGSDVVFSNGGVTTVFTNTVLSNVVSGIVVTNTSPAIAEDQGPVSFIDWMNEMYEDDFWMAA